MSVCGHDPACPGYGPRHDAQLPPAAWSPPTPSMTVTNPDKDRALPGKRRRKARQGRG